MQATARRIITRHELTLGAIWRLAIRRRLNRRAVIALLVERLKFSEAKAEQVAAHWAGTEKMRAAGACSSLAA